MRGEARNNRGWLYRQQPRLVTITTYPYAYGSDPDFSVSRTRSYWLGINAKKFRTRKDAVKYGYR